MFTVNLRANAGRSTNDEALADVVSPGPNGLLSFTQGREQFLSRGQEIQGDISPSGLHLPLSDFGMWQQYDLTSDKRLLVNGKTKQDFEINPAALTKGGGGVPTDEFAADFVLDRDGDNNGDTYFQFDVPGAGIRLFQEEFGGDPTLQSWALTWHFTTYPTYKGGTFGSPVRWSVSLTVKRNADNTISFS